MHVSIKKHKESLIITDTVENKKVKTVTNSKDIVSVKDDFPQYDVDKLENGKTIYAYMDDTYIASLE